MPIPPLLRELLTTPGPSGYEAAPAVVWRRAAEEFAEVWTDGMGSSYAKVVGTGGGPSLAVFGHIDEIGIALTHVDDQGLLRFALIGAPQPTTLVGQRVEILAGGGIVPGVIARRRLTPEQLKEGKAVELGDLHVDIGAGSREEALQLVSIGDPAVLAGPPVELHGGRFVSRSLDNRLGAFVALEAARRVAEAGGAAGDVVAVASVQEEIGLYGARTAAFSLEPQVGLAVDIASANDVPGGEPRLMGRIGLGCGPTIARGSTINPRVSELLREAAEADGIPFVVEVSTGRTYTDADYMQLSRGGIPTGLMSIPIRYTHSPIELVQWSDVEDATRLIVAFARRLSADTDFGR